MNLEKEAKEALLNKDAKRLKKYFPDTGIIAGTSMYPAGGQGGLYPYCTGSDPDGSGNRGGTGTEKRTDISSADFQGKWMDRCGRKSGYFFEYLTSKDEAENDMSLLIQRHWRISENIMIRVLHWKRLQKSYM